ncbi:class I SAM-dependent methyltransferase [Stackebrandtia nassauensis]|uniref:Methyltransferase type 11 n=1 Tax=Stackebrandtia nassauensis (strain DSM 44728 / CIP 108903 / NRRL B-16338 / NBRC 102104 / LLR-40K-21) TaxID=446470 RepID=D3Q3M4_STANL|nr:class I SAM-dependent methyltransferase [Stackebrandtia nassauensis]ADD43941.1 Methyltransferase type 11 [Stackebrandtia nassauensis DSM 44728]
MLYQHPLSYLLGLQGVALLRAWGGEHDRQFVHERIADIRRLLDDMEKFGDGGTAKELSVEDVYASWAAVYDEPGNGLIDMEQPRMRELLDALEPGVALDAACGTGRHAAYLAGRGHQVIGVDSSAEMLAVAREKLPEVEFHQAGLDALPVPDSHVDVIVCALALCHVPDLAPVFAEFARVLKPGGRLVISDTRGLLDNFDHPLVRYDDAGVATYSLNKHRSAAEYLKVALPLGLDVRHCAEYGVDGDYVDENGVPAGAASDRAPDHDPARMPNVWALHPFAVAATNAATRGNPSLIVWEFQAREG